MAAMTVPGSPTPAGDFAVMSLSRPRADKTFVGLPLAEALARRHATPQCGLQIIDLRSGAVAHGLKPEGMVTETYDVMALPGSTHPKALGFKSD